MHLKLLANKILRPNLLAVIFLTSSFTQGAWAYVRFSNKPVETWDSLFLESGAEKFYTVQTGDTLYGISRTLFGDPEFWPKIWSLNTKITNPHIIEKGQIIYFVGGTSYTPPSVGISDLKPESYTYGNHFISPEIPPAALKKGPIQLPDSLPNLFRFSQTQEESNEVDALSAGSRAALSSVRIVELTSEVSNTTPTSVGEVKRVFTGAKYAVVGDLVYLKVFSGAAVGDELSIFRTRPSWLPLRGKLSLKANLVEWLGRVKIKSTAEGGCVGEIVYANSIIQLGENLALRESRSVELPDVIDEDTLRSSVNGKPKIIGSRKVPGSSAIGEFEVVYFDSGSSAGIEEGGVYPLYTNFGEFGVSKSESIVPKRIGFVKMASVENGVSTGVVFNLISEVHVDQKIGL